ncbi:MAG: lysophospholipid acyltransferase family protein [Parahaliea sp.]
MNVVRSVLVWLWLALSVIPLGLAIVIAALFLKEERLWWWFAVPWLKGAVNACRLIGGVQYKIHGAENLPAPEDMQRIVLCPKHQSAWETFFFPSMTPHPLAYVFKKELLMIPVFGWAMGCLKMIHINRSRGSEAWSKVAEQGRTLMDRGKWVIMFPEGTRIARGKSGSYKSGAARLAVETGASIIPVAVTSARCWPPRSLFMKPGLIDVSIGAPIPTEGKKPNELTKELESWIEAEMRRLDPEAYC